MQQCPLNVRFRSVLPTHRSAQTGARKGCNPSHVGRAETVFRGAETDPVPHRHQKAVLARPVAGRRSTEAKKAECFPSMVFSACSTKQFLFAPGGRKKPRNLSNRKTRRSQVLGRPPLGSLGHKVGKNIGPDQRTAWWTTGPYTLYLPKQLLSSCTCCALYASLC